jgi:uncharacterized protein
MNLFRLIGLALLVWIAWFMLKNYLAKRRQSQAGVVTKRIQGKIVKCRTCEVHLPEVDAVRDGDDWFCGQRHRQAWLERE